MNLYKAAESVVELYTPAALEKKTSLFLSPTCNIMLRCDPDMLQVILRNLVGNSVKFTQNGEITVTCRLVGSMAEIAVSDTGLGMDAQTSENLFRKGTSVASRPGTRGEKGSALGLMLCAEFVDRHNGHIGVESQPGKGTTIRFTLPLHTSQQ
ncbi:MAG: HAMP domain-containing sensor histidine kinase [Bacteroidales bacterium]|nr:HAMP domain-containing sensor histidine kinase [Bacteroidales bacterium]